MDMVVELAVSTAMCLLTVVVHGIGLLFLGSFLQSRDRGANPPNPVSWEGAATTVVMVLSLLTLHGIEIWLYAALFHGIGAVPNLREGVYFSTISYASIGYGDAVVESDWKLVGAIEGINGALLLGWSVAFFVTVMTRFLNAHDGRRRRR